eukprot:scaffold122_cov387-Prasinococcus_capsulatus_cf.AAC.10
MAPPFVRADTGAAAGADAASTAGRPFPFLLVHGTGGAAGVLSVVIGGDAVLELDFASSGSALAGGIPSLARRAIPAS